MTKNAPCANPAGLGLAGFALTTFTLSTFNTGLISSRLEHVVLPLALFYGGLVQLLAGMWEFKAGNAFGATAFSSYGGFWMSFAAWVYLIIPTLPADEVHTANALFLLAWLIFTAYMMTVSWRTNGVIFSVFATLTITFLLLTAAEFSENANVKKAGGWFGLICAFCAWYGSWSSVMNETWHRKVLPTWSWDARHVEPIVNTAASLDNPKLDIRIGKDEHLDRTV